MCLLDSGDLLVSDESNPILKQINGETYEITYTLKLSAASFSVCKVNKTEALVALSNNRIQFVSTKNNLNASRSIKMDPTCLGVCVIADKIFITGGLNGSLFIHDMNGNVLNNVMTENIFYWNRFMVESDDGDAIYVIDGYNRLIKMNTQGAEVNWKCSVSALKGAFGLCTDGLGNVFIAGHGSGNVVQIGPNAQYVGEIISSGIPQTAGLCFDKKKSKLFV